MKTTKRILAFIFSVILFAASFTVYSEKEVKASTDYNKLEIENMQLNKARIKNGSSDSEGKHVEAYWQQEPLDSFERLTDITFARTVLEAEESGDYMLKIHCKNESGSDSITVKLYVNGTAHDIVVSGSAYQTVNETVALNKGKNSIVLAWVNWGYFDYINYPSELKVVSQSTDRKYYAFESALNEVQMTPTNGFHNPEAILYTAPIVYDSGDEEWQGSVTFNVDAAKEIKSIDLHYYVTEYNSGAAQLAMSVNGGKEIKLDLSGKVKNQELVYQISSKTLTEAGFVAGKTNKIKFRQSSASGGKIGLYYIELKEQVVEEVTTAAQKINRYEAESAYGIAGAKIKKSENEDEKWSKGGYVGEFTAASITTASQIDEYCSNIGYIQYRVQADQAGYYNVTLGYSTEVESMSVYVTSGYKWSKVQLTSTDKWSNVGETSTDVYLKKGENHIWVTGPASAKDWVNYDYIDVKFDKTANVDTSKTVLLLDDGLSASNSKVISNGEKTTTAEEEVKTDKNTDSTSDSSDKSLISPKTGISIRVPVIILLLSMIGLFAAYKKDVIKK